MDTRYWGPSGWQLLHAITFAYPQRPTDVHKACIRAFFEAVGHVLPCKFCRASFQQFTAELPIDASSRSALTHWLYTIHNLVNAKLRQQIEEGLIKGAHRTPPEDPPFERVSATYKALLRSDREKHPAALGEDFLYAVSWNFDGTPEKRHWYPIFFKGFLELYPFAPQYGVEPAVRMHPTMSHNKAILELVHAMMATLRGGSQGQPLDKTLQVVKKFHSAACKTRRYKGKTCRTRKAKTERDFAPIKARLL